jgi:hypothetical protein
LLLYSHGISRPRRALLASLLVFSAVHNLSESTLFDRASIVHIFFMIAVILIHRLSSQSLGQHHALRDRLARLAGAEQLAKMRRRFARDTRGQQSGNAARWAARSSARSTAAEDGPA